MIEHLDGIHETVTYKENTPKKYCTLLITGL